MKLFTTVFVTLTFITASLLFATNKKTDQSIINSYTNKCNKGDLSSCGNLGNLYSSGLLGVDIDYVKAFELYSFACDRNSFNGCVGLAGMYAEGKGVKQNYNKAIRIYYNACESSIGTVGCLELGHMYLNGQGVEIDYEKALNLFKKNCDSGDSDCLDYSDLYNQLCTTNPKPFCPKSKY